MSEGMPDTLQRSMGGMSVNRGNLDQEIQLFSWDAVPDCDEERCVSSHLCTYEHNGKCKVQLKFLKSINSVVFRKYGDLLDEAQFYRIGMHLIPLYKQLCRIYIEELAAESVVYVSSKGNLKPNPLFKEMRETIKLLELVWKTIGLDGIGVPDKPVMGESYYDMMANRDETKETGKKQSKMRKRKGKE